MSQTRYDILPQEQVRPTRFGSLAVLLVLAVILIVCANMVASSVLKRLPVNRGYALAYGKWSLMDRTLNAKKSAEVLIVGDSSSNQGISPRVIQQETGKSAINLGVVAEALTIEPVWTADRFFEQTKSFAKPPKKILWMHVYDVWSRIDRNDKRLRGISASLPSTSWPYIERGPKVKIDTLDLWLMQQVPLYFQNTSLATLVRRPIESYRFATRFKFDEFGFMAETTPDPALVKRDTRNHMKLVRDTPEFEMTAVSKRSIDAMSRIAARDGAEVWIVQSPLNRSLWQDPVFQQRWYQVRDALRSETARYPHVHVTFDEPVLFDDAQMQNADHVLADAAEAFTKIVIERTGLRPGATQPVKTLPPPTTSPAKRKRSK
jgi:hypothetical protein